MTDAMFRVLVVEDDASIRTVLRMMLQSAGYRVELAENATRALVETHSNRPDAVLVDLGLPDLDGQQLIREIRSCASVPVIVLSARCAERQKVMALDNGADDYMTKPFDVDELLARLRAAIRRSVCMADKCGNLKLGRLNVDLARRDAHEADEPVHLTPLEFRLLGVLARNLGLVVAHDQIIREVWGPGHLDDTRGLRTYIKMLRQKIEPDPGHPRLLLTTPGGYLLRAAPTAPGS